MTGEMAGMPARMHGPERGPTWLRRIAIADVSPLLLKVSQMYAKGISAGKESYRLRAEAGRSWRGKLATRVRMWRSESALGGD